MPRTLQRSFSGGEITPELYGRLDLDKFQTGLATCKNGVVLPHGPVQNRPGTVFIRQVKDSADATVVLPFYYSAEQSYALELGDGYLRVHTEGATLLVAPAAYSGVTAYVVGNLVVSGGVNYYCIAPTTGNAPPNATYWYPMPAGNLFEMPTPYASADLFDLQIAQSADVFTIVHPSYAPRELRRLGATYWTLTAISFVPIQAAPTGVSATPTGTGSVSYQYVVTALADSDLEESFGSTASAAVTNNLATAGNYNTINWTGASGAVRYNVYKLSNGLYGYIGQASGTSFKDDNITADVTRTPPEDNNPFTGVGEYPAAVGYFEGRRWFGGSNNKPQNLWGTRSGTESNMSRSIPLRDDDAITVRLLSRAASRVRHILPITELLLLTSESEWRVSGANSDVLTPTSIGYRAVGYTGAAVPQPVITQDAVIYSQDRGGRLREMAYVWEKQSYSSVDLSILAPHLFDAYTVRQLAFTRAPHTTVWAVRSDGVLLGVTYAPEHKVRAIHWHQTLGEIESVASVVNGTEETLYLVVKRAIDGADVRYIEYLHSRRFTAVEDAFFVDCGLTYDGTPTTTLTGLDHLEGEEVSVLADGFWVQGLVVTSGAILLPEAASVIHVGLPYTMDLKTLPLSLEMEAGAQGIEKNINQVAFRVNESSHIQAGPDYDRLRTYAQRTTEPYGSPPALLSQAIDLVIDPDWNTDGQVVIRQSAPLPITVLGLVLDAALGG